MRCSASSCWASRGCCPPTARWWWTKPITWRAPRCNSSPIRWARRASIGSASGGSAPRATASAAYHPAAQDLGRARGHADGGAAQRVAEAARHRRGAGQGLVRPAERRNRAGRGGWPAALPHGCGTAPGLPAAAGRPAGGRQGCGEAGHTARGGAVRGRGGQPRPGHDGRGRGRARRCSRSGRRSGRRWSRSSSPRGPARPMSAGRNGRAPTASTWSARRRTCRGRWGRA